MRIRYAFAAIPALMIAGHTPAFAQSTTAQTSTAATCDDSTIAGQYAAHGAGSVGSAAPYSPEMVVSIRHFDGQGKFTGHGRQTIAGTPHQFTISGTYTVQTDCTITLTGKTVPAPSGAPLHWFGVVTNNGNAIYVIRDDPGATTSTTFNRIAPFS